MAFSLDASGLRAQPHTTPGFGAVVSRAQAQIARSRGHVVSRLLGGAFGEYSLECFPLRGPTQSEGGYFPDCQSCLDTVINEAQSLGGYPRVSILAKTANGSVLLPEERSVDWSLTHA